MTEEDTRAVRIELLKMKLRLGLVDEEGGVRDCARCTPDGGLRAGHATG